METIFLISRNSSRVRVKDIAEKLSVTKPSVHQALHELEQRGLISHEPYGDVILTSRGAKKAADISERHTLLTRFLVEDLGVSPKVAERDACAMEHDLSEETLSKIKMFRSLGAPKKTARW